MHICKNIAVSTSGERIYICVCVCVCVCVCLCACVCVYICIIYIVALACFSSMEKKKGKKIAITCPTSVKTLELRCLYS
jgi:hypothetical protein